MPSLNNELEQFQASWLAQMPAAVTVLDPEGRLLFYNDHAPTMLDRKPEYLGRPVQELHKPASNAKIEAILEDYRQGGRQEHTWTVRRGERTFLVRVAPWLEGERHMGLIHAALLLPDRQPAS